MVRACVCNLELFYFRIGAGYRASKVGLRSEVQVTRDYFAMDPAPVGARH